MNLNFTPIQLGTGKTITLLPLTGQWITRCTVCGIEYEQGVGSTPCCGALQEIIEHNESASAPGHRKS